MITVLAGENDFEIARETRELASSFSGEVERFEGGSLRLEDMPDLLFGTTLFAVNRLIIIRNLSDNRAIWSALPEYIPKISEDIRLVLVEPRPDKRTKTYKTLQKHADIKEYKQWGERETAAAERWTSEEASRMGVSFDSGAVRLLVRRSLVVTEKGAIIDQWLLRSNLEKLAPLGAIGAAEIEAYIEETPVESVFSLFETALSGDIARVKQAIGRLEATEDPFRLFGLLSGQVFWLAALSAGDKPGNDVAKDIGAHPYAIGKLTPHAQRLGQGGAKKVTAAFAEADSGMKTSAAEPWLLIERALIKVASLRASGS